MTALTPKALLIDLDDTLFPESAWVDSGLRAAALELAFHAGVEAEDALARLRYEHRRMGRTGAFDRACAWYGVDPAPVAEMVEAYRNHAPALRLYPGVAEALEALRARFRLAVVTDGMALMQGTKCAALKIADRVDEVVLCDEEGAAKPSPLGYARSAERLGAAPADCLIVGDDPYLDADAAAAFGAPFCRVLTGRFADVERPGAHPDLRIAAFADLPAALGLEPDVPQ